MCIFLDKAIKNLFYYVRNQDILQHKKDTQVYRLRKTHVILNIFGTININ